MKLLAKITCPFCGFVAEVKMPENACVYFYTCTNCGKMIKPKRGDDCVFCSYADTQCPDQQKGIEERDRLAEVSS